MLLAVLSVLHVLLIVLLVVPLVEWSSDLPLPPLYVLLSVPLPISLLALLPLPLLLVPLIALLPALPVVLLPTESSMVATRHVTLQPCTSHVEGQGLGVRVQGTIWHAIGFTIEKVWG